MKNKKLMNCYEVRGAVKMDLEKKYEILKKALEEISEPVLFLQKEAKLQGCILDGSYAAMISQDANYLKDIAKKALKKIN